MIGQFIISLSWKVHYDWLIYYISCLELVNLFYLSVRMCTIIGQFILFLSYNVHYDWSIYYISVRMCTIIDQFIVFLS